MPRGLSPEVNQRIRVLVRQLYQESGLSQEAFAERLGMTQSGFNTFITGRGGTSVDVAAKAAEMGKVSLLELLGIAAPPGVLGSASVQDVFAELLRRPPGEVAALIARQILVDEESIHEVLAEPMTPDRVAGGPFYLAELMRLKSLGKHLAHPPQPEARDTAGAGGARRKATAGTR
jgi:transcriptional regulator with XRE-family HTH domain